MSIIEKHAPKKVTTGFALVMESDLDLRGVIHDALVLDGHRVECASDCAAVLARCTAVGPSPDELVLALGAGDEDPDWNTLRGALDQDTGLSRAAVIVLLTIRNGMTFLRGPDSCKSRLPWRSCSPSSRPTWLWPHRPPREQWHWHHRRGPVRRIVIGALADLSISAERNSVFTTIAILIVGCFVVYAVVLAVASFTDGGRAREVATAPAIPRRRIRR